MEHQLVPGVRGSLVKDHMMTQSLLVHHSGEENEPVISPGPLYMTALKDEKCVFHYVTEYVTCTSLKSNSDDHLQSP